MIIFDDTSKIFHISSQHSSMLITILPSNHLGQLYYGNRLQEPINTSRFALKHPLETGSQIAYSKADKTFSLNNTLLEYSTFGKGDYRAPALDIRFQDGSRLMDFHYLNHEILDAKPMFDSMPQTFDSSGNNSKSLIISLKDQVHGILLHLHYTVYPQIDVITKRVVLSNVSEQVIQIEKVMSLQQDLPESAFELVSFDGTWIRERHPNSRDLSPGIFTIDSKKGVSSSDHNPFVILKRKHTNEEFGEAYGFSLLWSGNFEASVEVNPHDLTRLLLGINSFDFSYRLEPLQTFVSPEAVCSYTMNGLATLSHHFHDVINQHLIPLHWQQVDRPILLNNWEATYFQFSESKLLQLAKIAKRVGIELFVLDDGWFGKRDDDTSSLGDWTVHQKKIPSGLHKLVQKINHIGLNFGIWVEPEMVSPDSDLFRMHPDWAISHPKSTPSLGRNQLVLDLSNPLVRDYLVEVLSQLFESAAITYCKWDMNRNLSDLYSNNLPANRQMELSYRYTLGLYDILERLTKKFPTILFESCASGGNRFDMGMLYYMPQTWTSDNTDAHERQKIQYGTSFLYPPSTMGAHVSNSPNSQVVRSTSIETRFHTAMYGLLGYELDLTRLSPFDLFAMKEQIAFYKLHRHTLQFGRFYRRGNPFKDNEFLWISQNQETEEALVGLFQTKSNPNPGYQFFRLPMLSTHLTYHVTSRVQYHHLSLFGDLVKHALPIHLKAYSLPFAFLSARYKLKTEQDDFIQDGPSLSSRGFTPKQPFIGTGVNDSVRLMGDYGSRSYVFTPIRKEEEHA